jgi:transposase-like protein
MENQSNRDSKRKYSDEERRNYCIAWKKSGLNRTDFCQEYGISRSALYQWTKEFEKGNKEIDFSPIVVKDKSPAEETGIIQLNIDCPNNMRLSISIPEYRLISFILEIGYATSTVW